MIVAGLGCRKNISAIQVEAAIEATLGRHLLARHQLDLIAVPTVKATETAILSAAAARGVRIVLIPPEALEAASPRTLTRSRHSMAAMHVHSVAEAAALAAAGPGARLLARRLAVGPVTCALAQTEAAP